MRVTTKKATGVLAKLLANIDEKEMARTRKRMMLAAKIEDAMKRRGLNQAQLARLMGKSQTVISEWLSGDRNFTVDTLADIEEALDVQILNLSLMTVISSSASSTCVVSSKRKTLSNMKTQGSWRYSSGSFDSEYSTKYA